MQRLRTPLASFFAALALATAGCNKVYTEADLPGEEQKLDAAADSEEEYDREIGESGGVNEVLLEGEADEVFDESDR